MGLKAEVIYFFLGGVLIDIDHYIDYVIRFKDFGLDGMFEYYCDALHPTNRGSKPYLWLGIFHTVEFFACMYLASLIVPGLWFVMLGMLFHLVLDIIFLYRLNVLQDRAISLIEYLVRIGHYRDSVREIDAAWFEQYSARKK